MGTIIAIANQKGGVGKTTTTVNIGAALAKLGKKILLIDFDPQANLSSYMGYNNEGVTIDDLISLILTTQAYQAWQIDTHPGKGIVDIHNQIKNAILKNGSEYLDYIPSSILLSGAEQALMNAMCREKILSILLSHVDSSYDYVFIDCPPSLGILSINALTAADKILVPVQAENFALDGLIQLLSTYKCIKATSNPKLEIQGFLLTMTQATTMSYSAAKALVDQFGDMVYKETISRATLAAQSSALQKSLISIHDKNNKPGKQYQQATLEFLEKENAE